MKTKKDKIGETLSQARKRKGYSEERMAFAMNVTRQTISNWENGCTQINPDDFATYFKKTNQDILPALEYIFDIELDANKKLYNLIQNMDTKRKETLIAFLELNERSINEK